MKSAVGKQIYQNIGRAYILLGLCEYFMMQTLRILSLPIDLLVYSHATLSIDKWLFHVSSIEVIHSSVAIDVLHAAE